ncbi:MAG: electron transfer flavoprotein subunit alpha/FixB family protein, partial [Bacteroidota bacterium]
MVLVFAESHRGQFKKAALEAVTYGRKSADIMGDECIALTLGPVNDAGVLGTYGAHKVINIADASLSQLDGQVYASVIADVARQHGAKLVVLSHTSTGKAVAGRLAVRLDAGIASGINSLPTVNGGTVSVSKSVFSGKAIAGYELSGTVNVVTLMGNAVRPETMGSPVSIDNQSVT